MKKQKNIGLDFEIDKLTRSIENVVSGDSFPTDIILVTQDDIKSITKKNDWVFNWKFEFKQPERDVYKLTIVDNQSVIQGLISFEVRQDHVYIHLVENAPFNRGRTKIYAGVAGNLIAFACKVSFQMGFEGNVAFVAKTLLIEHYSNTLGAIHIGHQRMIIIPSVALNLIDKYFKK